MTQSFSAIDVAAAINERGIVRPSRFLLSMGVPPALRRYSQVGADLASRGDVSMWCEAASLPGVALDYHPVRRYGYGPVENRPFAPKYTDVSLRLRLDAQGLVFSIAHAWMRSALDYNYAGTMGSVTGPVRGQHSYELGYKSDYAQDVRVTQFDDAGEPVVSVVLREAYPVYVGDAPLDWASSSEYSRLPVTLTFIGWYADYPSQPFAS